MRTAPPIVRHTLPIGEAFFYIGKIVLCQLISKLIILPLNSIDDLTKHDHYTSNTLTAVGYDWLLEIFYIDFEGVF